MRKTLIYFVLLAILGLGVYYFLYKKEDNTFAANEAAFTIKDTANIGKIFISGQRGISVLLERTDSGWIVNKKYKALKGTTNSLLKVLARQMPIYPVPKNLHNTVITGMSGTAIKVEIDNRQGEKMRVFYVGGETDNYKGSYMLMEGAQRPYVVNLPNFDGYLTPFYSFKIGDWRDRTVFNLAPDQIKSVSVQYPEHPLNSFVINQDKGKISVDAQADIAKMAPLNMHRASSYLKFFQNVNCEGYLADPAMDSILKEVPKHCVMEVQGTTGQHQHLDIYWMPINKRSKNMVADAPGIPENKYDADRFFAVMNDYRDTIVIQVNTFKKLFRNSYEFYQADPPPEAPKPYHVMPDGVIK